MVWISVSQPGRDVMGGMGALGEGEGSGRQGQMATGLWGVGG